MNAKLRLVAHEGLVPEPLQATLAEHETIEAEKVKRPWPRKLLAISGEGKTVILIRTHRQRYSVRLFEDKRLVVTNGSGSRTEAGQLALRVALENGLFGRDGRSATYRQWARVPKTRRKP